MSGWPVAIPGFTELDRFDLATTDEKQTTVTADSTIHTKGAWVELDASTSQDCYMLGLSIYDTGVSGTLTGMLLDIGVGGSGSEVVLIADICAGWRDPFDDNRIQNTFTIPLFIPAGTRIAARCQALIVSDTVLVGVKLLGNPNGFNHDMRQFGNPVTYGAVAATSLGTLVTGAAADTKGSWTEIVASTTEPHAAVGISVQAYTDTSLTSQWILLDVGFGASGSEQVILGDILIRGRSAERMYSSDQEFSSLGIGRVLASGVRLAARLQSAAGANDDITLCLHGVT